MTAVLDAHTRGDLLALRTSGTSGRPRSVVRTTDSWFDSFDQVTRLVGVDPSSRVWIPGPLTSTMNLFAAVHAAVVGARTQAGPGGASHAVLTPAALARGIAHGTDLRAMHLLVAGDRVARGLHDAALAHGAAAVSHYYGAAELSFVAWGSHADDLRPFPDVEVESDDDDVLWVRSAYLCRGYDGPDGPLARRPDGFASVGDRGRLEGDYLRVLGRRSDTVVTAGTTVLIADVESVLEAATGQRLVVVGVPHDYLGQVLCGVVTDAATLPVLRAAAREHLDPARRPRRWVTVADLPLTAAGKLDRGRLTAALSRDAAVP